MWVFMAEKSYFQACDRYSLVIELGRKVVYDVTSSKSLLSSYKIINVGLKAQASLSSNISILKWMGIENKRD